jgi:hypothetical protein
MERNTYKLCDDGRRQSNFQSTIGERIWKFKRQIPLEIHFSEKQKKLKFGGVDRAGSPVSPDPTPDTIFGIFRFDRRDDLNVPS